MGARSALLSGGHLSKRWAVVGRSAVVNRWPIVFLFAALSVAQELNPAALAPGTPGLLLFGHQFYYTTVFRLSVVTLVAVAVACVVWPRHRPNDPRALWVAILLGCWCAGLAWLAGESPLSAVNQDARFALLFAVAFVAGTALHADDISSRFLLLLFGTIAVVGVILFASGDTFKIYGSAGQFVFYDSAMAATAGALLLALISQQDRRNIGYWMLLCALAVIVLLSFRRAIWVAIFVASLAGLAGSGASRRVALYVIVGAIAVIAALFVFDHSLFNTLSNRILSSLPTGSKGNASATSTTQHLSDLRVGWTAATSSPWSGVGPNGHIRGLVVENSNALYIHNEFLELWLRFGLVALLAFVSLTVITIWQALKVLRRTSTVMERWAAYLLIMAPVALMTAPFFSTTQRWPSLLGIAAGVVAVRTGSASDAHLLPNGSVRRLLSVFRPRQ